MARPAVAPDDAVGSSVLALNAEIFVATFGEI
jgi:hypothetical protein